MSGWARTAALGALFAMLALALAVLPGVPATAATSTRCAFADPGTGGYAQTLCWLDLSGYDSAEATAPAGQDMTVALPGGYTLAFTLRVSGGPVTPVPFPTWSGAYLGQDGHYDGVAGRPALYQQVPGSTSTATLNNVVLTAPAGEVVTGYALVGADAESSDGGEALSWAASTPLSSLGPLGNACGGGFTGVGTTTVTCTGASTGAKTGTAIVAADHPSSFAVTLVGGGLQGAAFGVLTSRVQFVKHVVNGFAGDSFRLAVRDGSGELGSAETAGGSNADTGPVTVLGRAGPAAVTLAETASSGRLGNYTQSWSCTRNGNPDPAVGGGASASVELQIGDFEVCTLTNTARPVGLTLHKRAGTPVDANADGLVDAGDTIRYSFDVRNSGELPVEALVVHDPKVGPVTCLVTTLAPGATTTCTAPRYTITLADEASGAVDNTATATATPAGTTATVTSDPSTTHTVTTTPAPAISLVKTASPSGVDALRAGARITYRFRITNIGNVPLAAPTIYEKAFSGTGTLSGLACPATSLPPGASTTCTAGYRVTQADVDAGSLSNTATAAATPPSGIPVQSAASSVTVPGVVAPALALQKSARPAIVHRAGEKITYSFRVINTGNVTVRWIHIDDTAFTGRGRLSAITCPGTPLSPGAAITCTATYVATQADVDRGAISNTATAAGTAADGRPVTSGPSTARVRVPAAPALTLVKSAAPADPDSFRGGQLVTYSFVVTNTGNVTLTDVAVREGPFSGHGRLSPVTCPPRAAALRPRVSITCTATYRVTPADVRAGAVTNAAGATARPPAGGPIRSAPSRSALPADPASLLRLTKTGRVIDRNGDGRTGVGDQVQWTLRLRNVGTDTAHRITLLDPGARPVTCPATTLAPGRSMICTVAAHVITAADIARGSVRNQATVNGHRTGDPTVYRDAAAVVVSLEPASTARPADTGTDDRRLVALAVALLAGGGLLLVATRLRRT